MPKTSKLSRANAVVEPPRDGEFFFDDVVVDEPVEHRGIVEQLNDFVERNPVLALGLAIALGVFITSFMLDL